MCGRYTASENLFKTIERMFIDLGNDIPVLPECVDFRPGMGAPVMEMQNGNLVLTEKHWGYQTEDGHLVINARAETIREKYMFYSDMENRRILIPCDSFFEWNIRKEKYTFERPDGAPMFLAGICNEKGDFVILTTQANASVNDVHDRMPLILEKDQVMLWMNDNVYADVLLQKTPVQLKKHTRYEQISLF